MDLDDDITENIEEMELYEIIKKFEESNHQKLEKSLIDFVSYFKRIHKELGLEWTEEDNLNISTIFDAILERAKLEAIQIMLSTTHCDSSKKSGKK